jgi:hypothetical protein
VTSTHAAPALPRTAPTRPHRRRRTIAAAGLVVAGLAVLTGCMKIDMAFTLSEEDTVSGTMVMALSDEFAESLGMDPQELWDSANEGEDSLTEDLPEGATEEPYSDGEYTGVQVTYADQPIADMASEDLSITREGDEFVIDGVMDFTDDEAAETGEMPAEILDSFLMRIAVTFPGEVIETNGTVDGSTVTWEPVFGEVTEITARGSAVAGGGGGEGDAGAGAADPSAEPGDEAGGGADDEAGGTGSSDEAVTPTAADADSGAPWWAIALGVLVGLGVVGVVVTLIVRNNRRPDQPTTSNPQDLFGRQNPPSVQPGQPPVDPYHPGGPPPEQGPR